MIRFNRNDSLNSDLLTPTGCFNFTFKESFDLISFFFNEYSTFYILFIKINKLNEFKSVCKYIYATSDEASVFPL